MKAQNIGLKILLMIAFLCIQLTAFSQSLEQTFSQLLEEYKKSPKEYAQRSYSEDYRFLGWASGKIMGKSEMLAFLGTLKVAELSCSDLKFVESGNVGVVSGYLTAKYAANTYKDAFTYVYQKQKGKWVNISGQHTKVSYDEPSKIAAEEMAIKKVISQSTDSLYAGKLSFYVQTLANQPYSSRTSVNAEGKLDYYAGEELAKLIEDYKKNIAKNPTTSTVIATRANWLIRVNGSSAFVTFDQHNQNSNGTKRDSKEMRYLEKTNGEWKVVSVVALVKK